jgi:hypothetical protein
MRASLVAEGPKRRVASATRRDRTELNQGEDFPLSDRPAAPGSADRRVADLPTVVSVLRACYERRCGD